MGSSQSSNTASALAEISNDVVNNTTTKNSQGQTCQASVHIDACNISGGKFNVQNLCNVTEYSSQLQNANTNTSISNDIAQKLAQEASSSVGFAGIGIADSTNSASVMSSATTDIKSATSLISTQTNNSLLSFTCENSNIENEDIDLQNIANGNFASSQVQKSQQIQSLSNKISQSITQKATAKVVGAAGALLALAVLIIAIGYSFAKPITAAVSSKYIMVPIVLVIFGIILTIMYLHKSPPFFNDLIDCDPTATFNSCDSDCINLKNKTINLRSAPLKYSLPIYRDPLSSKEPSLCGIYLLSQASQKITTIKFSGVTYDIIPPKDNKKSKNMSIETFIKSATVEQLSELRDFLLQNVLPDVKLGIYVDGEKVQDSDKKFKYTLPANTDIKKFLLDGNNSSGFDGTITGSFGICNTNGYKFQNFMKKMGGYILIGISIIILGIIFLPLIFKNKK